MPAMEIRPFLNGEAFVSKACFSPREICHCTPVYRQSTSVEWTEMHSGNRERPFVVAQPQDVHPNARKVYRSRLWK